MSMNLIPTDERKNIRSRNDYVNYCQTLNEDFLKDRRVLIQHIRLGEENITDTVPVENLANFRKELRKGPRVGVVVAFLEDGIIHIGWSRCNVKKEGYGYDEAIGLRKAIERAKPYADHDLMFEDGETIRKNLKLHVSRMHYRASKAFARKETVQA